MALEYGELRLIKCDMLPFSVCYCTCNCLKLRSMDKCTLIMGEGHYSVTRYGENIWLACLPSLESILKSPIIINHEWVKSTNEPLWLLPEPTNRLFINFPQGFLLEYWMACNNGCLRAYVTAYISFTHYLDMYLCAVKTACLEPVKRDLWSSNSFYWGNIFLCEDR